MSNFDLNRILFLAFTLFGVCAASIEVKINEHNYMTMSISADHTDSVLFEFRNTDLSTDWVSIGIGGDLMERVDVHLINWNIDSNSFVQVYDYWSPNYQMPGEDGFGGGHNDCIIQKMTQNPTTNERYVSYLRKLKTGDKFDNDIVLGSNKLVTAWAYSQIDMSQHGSYAQVGTFTLNSDNTIDISLGRYLPWEIHGIILLIGWTILNSMSYYSSRVMKHSPGFMWFHRIMGFFKGFTSIGLVVLGLATGADAEDGDVPFIIHKIGGLVGGGIIILIFITGTVQSILVTGKNLHSGAIFKYRIVHKVLGILISYILSAVIITGSFQLYQD